MIPTRNVEIGTRKDQLLSRYQHNPRDARGMFPRLII
jgi:hypothetical protein